MKKIKSVKLKNHPITVGIDRSEVKKGHTVICVRKDKEILNLVNIDLAEMEQQFKNAYENMDKSDIEAMQAAFTKHMDAPVKFHDASTPVTITGSLTLPIDSDGSAEEYERHLSLETTKEIRGGGNYIIPRIEGKVVWMDEEIPPELLTEDLSKEVEPLKKHVVSNVTVGTLIPCKNRRKKRR